MKKGCSSLMYSLLQLGQMTKKCTQVSKAFLHCYFSLNNTFPKALIKLFLLQQSL